MLFRPAKAGLRNSHLPAIRREDTAARRDDFAVFRRLGIERNGIHTRRLDCVGDGGIFVRIGDTIRRGAVFHFERLALGVRPCHFEQIHITFKVDGIASR